jgi:hypothetical protein
MQLRSEGTGGRGSCQLDDFELAVIQNTTKHRLLLFRKRPDRAPTQATGVRVRTCAVRTPCVRARERCACSQLAFDAQRNGRAGGRTGWWAGGQVGRWAGEGFKDRDVTANMRKVRTLSRLRRNEQHK